MAKWKVGRRSKVKGKKKKGGAIPLCVDEAISQLSLHSAVVQKTIKLLPPRTDGSNEIVFHVEVSLPTKAYAAGVSVFGVKAVEPISFILSAKYPFDAPSILLREDFPLHFPHLNPVEVVNGRKHINPCVLYGKLGEFLWASPTGLLEIVDRLINWLGRAACGDLIDPAQGWEPIRRDREEYFYSLIYDIGTLASAVTTDSGSLVFGSVYNNLKLSSGEKPAAITGIILEDQKHTDLSVGLVERYLQKQYALHESKVKDDVGVALAYLCWGKSEVATYRYDTVANLESLLECAEFYGCEKEVEEQINTLRIIVDQSKWATQFKTLQFNVFFVICVKRPFNLIDSDYSFEFIPYLASLRFERDKSPLSNSSYITLSKESPVFSCSHQHQVSRSLLRRLSDGTAEVTDQPIVCVGCGSLGSKIAMHLARAGYGPFTFVDESNFSPHNTARHALAGNYLTPIGMPKAHRLANEIEKMGQEVPRGSVICNDIIGLMGGGRGGEGVFPDDTALIVESTGSMVVREFLSSHYAPNIPGTLFHTILLGNGKVGIIAIEGQDRNPNIGDLTASLWHHVIDNKELRDLLSEEGITRQAIGQGCDSFTMVMPDAEVSLFAAGMAEKARQVLKNGTNPAGELLVGLKDNSGLGVTWEVLPVCPSVVIIDSKLPHWEIRVAQEVVEQIDKESRDWGKIETGGVLFGRISHLRHSITITSLVEAPPDSERSENQFILGTEGLRKKVNELHSMSCNALTYVGTWHSHPRGGGASPLDSATLAKLMESRLGFPAVFLIWTPGQGLLVKVGEFQKK